MCFFCVEGLRPALKSTSCVRRVPLRSFHRRISSPLASCNVWLFMCAYFYALVASVVADRNVMIASRLLGAAAARVILLSFAAHIVNRIGMAASGLR